ncbi:MAG: hypothetical protein ABEJ28_10620 [Salinigranum sp.]
MFVGAGATHKMRKAPLLLVIVLLAGGFAATSVAYADSSVGDLPSGGPTAADPAPNVATGATSNAVAGPSAGASAGTSTNASAGGGTNSTNGSDVAPGARFAGVVSVQGDEVSGEIRSRTFEQRLNASRTNRTRAAVVASEVNDSRERLTELQRKRRHLEAARTNGSIDRSRYRVELARLAVQTATLRRMLNRSSEVSRTVPADLLGRHGVSEEGVRTLQKHASEMDGPEVAAAARTITGSHHGESFGAERGDHGRRSSAEGARGHGESARGSPGAQEGADTGGAAKGGESAGHARSGNRTGAGGAVSAGGRDSADATSGSSEAGGAVDVTVSGDSTGGTGDSLTSEPTATPTPDGSGESDNGTA